MANKTKKEKNNEIEPQTEIEIAAMQEESADAVAEDLAPKTETDVNMEMGMPAANPDIASEPEEATVKKPAKRKKKSDAQNESTEESVAMPKKKPEKKRASVKPIQVISIDEQRSVETEADKEKNDLIDLMESLRVGKVLAGTIQGVERSSDNHSMAVIYHGAFKIVIPAEEAVIPPDDYRDQNPADVLHYLLTKRLGAEVDFIVKGIDKDANVAVASRLDAMKSKRKQYYFGTDREGNNLLYSGQCAEARVVSVIRAGIFVDIFGLEVYIPLRELSYQRIMNAAEYFRPGQRILVKILELDRTDKNNIKVTASVKQSAENPYEKALRR